MDKLTFEQIETLTAEQIHQAFETLLAEVAEGKLELACAVRSCCRSLPTGRTIVVAGRSLRWIEAYCAIWGGRDWKRGDTYNQRVLVLNGHLLDEPLIEITRPDLAHSQHWDAVWKGPVGGWYSVSAQQRYERLCAEYEGSEVSVEKPAALPECDEEELSAIARSLPTAMATWHYHQHNRLTGTARRLRANTASLLLRNDELNSGN